MYALSSIPNLKVKNISFKSFTYLSNQSTCA
ncbi:MAG: hypothetical protein LDL01_06660 [Ignavibacterium sp.]|nr:hypothetical protein [Ignavibacterium sp.]